MNIVHKNTVGCTRCGNVPALREGCPVCGGTGQLTQLIVRGDEPFETWGAKAAPKLKTRGKSSKG